MQRPRRDAKFFSDMMTTLQPASRFGPRANPVIGLRPMDWVILLTLIASDILTTAGNLPPYGEKQ